MTPTYFAPPPQPGHMHLVAPLPRPTNVPPQRKRPKYTRSKTGCLTCRAKKIKCDETKPSCLRCTHGQRECTWPEGLPARKKAPPKKQSVPIDNRPSTAESSGVSESSTPPTRNNTPPKPENGAMELSLPPPASTRRHSEPYLTLPPAADTHRRQSIPSLQATTHGYPAHSLQSHALPVIPEMTSSYPSQRYNSAYSSTPLHAHSPGHHSVDSGHIPSRSSSSNNTIRRVEHGPHHAPQWVHHNSHLIHPVDPIEPYFQTVQERHLIRHYCDTSLNIIMAVPFENPVAAANVSLVFNRPLRSDPATEALRLALLGVAAVHQSFQIGRGGSSPEGSVSMMNLAQAYRLESTRWLTAACSTADGVQSDAALSASITIALIDIFTGGHRWHKNLNVAKGLVKSRGGPSAMLARRVACRPGTVTGTSRAKLLLEILAIYDMFGSLATGREPTILGNGSVDWWSVSLLHDDTVAKSHVENVFGMSRTLVPLLAQVVASVARALSGRAHVVELPDSVTSAADPSSECTLLYNDLDNWAPPAEDIPARVRTGNMIYVNAAKIVLLRDVGQVSPDDHIVQRCVETILTLCLRCAENKLSVDLNWPVIIAASHAFGESRRQVLDLFEAFRYVRGADTMVGCYEIDTSEQIVLEVWKRLDQNHPGADWRSTMRDLNLDVLIL
ncbi:hypothetical protein NEOLEDRAFT_1062539 [Neolentinus lepideus HHB14362 ss-1]|uniref:Zn(2)-C6 fungal-type domain-containing protein n=1 Tax=Neolentinus lepideus HHB14362 ss-1 TaxID=1314782 RepID=A0A165TIH1_9AGAM|nr:hypothetical protein NEOLEDRAFT_1062539 [Neolentinus lepideus HHB14362 ss-1]